MNPLFGQRDAPKREGIEELDQQAIAAAKKRAYQTKRAPVAWIISRMDTPKQPYCSFYRRILAADNLEILEIEIQDDLFHLWIEEDHVWFNQQGQLHRVDGPAMVYKSYGFDAPTGTNVSYWYQNGKLHRADGPAKESVEEEIWAYQNNFYRKDGPAVVNKLTGKETYYAGMFPISKEEYWNLSPQDRQCPANEDPLEILKQLNAAATP